LDLQFFPGRENDAGINNLHLES